MSGGTLSIPRKSILPGLFDRTTISQVSRVSNAVFMSDVNDGYWGSQAGCSKEIEGMAPTGLGFRRSSGSRPFRAAFETPSQAMSAAVESFEFRAAVRTHSPALVV